MNSGECQEVFQTFQKALEFTNTHIESEAVPLIAFMGYEIDIFAIGEVIKMALQEWFKAEYLGSVSRIDKVRAEKITDKTMILESGRKERLVSSWHSFFPSREEAKQWLISKAKGEVVDCRRRLKQSIETLNEIQNL